MEPHYRPQVLGNGLKKSLYIPRMDACGPTQPVPHYYPPAPIPACPPGFQPQCVPVYTPPRPAIKQCPPQPVTYIGYPPACPPGYQPACIPNPSQTVGGGYNFVSPNNPAGYAPPPQGNLPAARPQPMAPMPGAYYGPTTTEHKYNMSKAIAAEQPQDMQPSDPDPNRFYQVQELDGSWTRRNRRTIDGFLGSIRWYQRPDGTWFAIRLSDG